MGTTATEGALTTDRAPQYTQTMTGGFGKIGSQADDRTLEYYRDQHDRTWWAHVEKKSNAPVGRYELTLEGLAAEPPLMPDPKYLHLSTGRGRYGLRTLEIDYDSWLNDLRTAWLAWEAKAQGLMQERYGVEYRTGMAIDEDLGPIAGPRPFAPEPVIAAKQGNAWVLGFSAEEDARLAPFFVKVAAIRTLSRFDEAQSFTTPDAPKARKAPKE